MILKSYEYYIAMYKDKVFMLPISEDKVASYRIANPDMKPTKVSYDKMKSICKTCRCLICVCGIMRKMVLSEYVDIVRNGSSVVNLNSDSSISINLDAFNQSLYSIGPKGLKTEDTEINHGREELTKEQHEIILSHYRHLTATHMEISDDSINTPVMRSYIDTLYDNILSLLEKSVLNIADNGIEANIHYKISTDRNGYASIVHLGNSTANLLTQRFELKEIDLCKTKIQEQKDMLAILSYKSQLGKVWCTTINERKPTDNTEIAFEE